MAEKIMVCAGSNAFLETTEDEIGIVRLMIEEVGGDEDLQKIQSVIKDLEGQGYEKSHAITLCIAAGSRMIKIQQLVQTLDIFR